MNITGFDFAQQQYEQRLPPTPTPQAAAIEQSLEQEQDRLSTLRDELEDITVLCDSLKYLDCNIISRIKEQYSNKISASLEMVHDLQQALGRAS